MAIPRDKALEPGGETVVKSKLKMQRIVLLVEFEVAVVVVDESVLALTGYKLDDPLAIFYSQRGADTTDYHLRANVLLARPGTSRFGIGGRLRGGGGVDYNGVKDDGIWMPYTPSPQCAQEQGMATLRIGKRRAEAITRSRKLQRTRGLRCVSPDRFKRSSRGQGQTCPTT